MNTASPLLVFDPGLTTGWAAFNDTPKGIAVAAAGVLVYRPGAALELLTVFEEHEPSLVIYEDWENQGVDVNIHSSWPNRVIGAIELAAVARGHHMSSVAASKWKPSFADGAELLPSAPIELPAKYARIAARVMLELGYWPTEALQQIPPSAVRHVIDALGLGCWWLCTARFRLATQPRTSTRPTKGLWRNGGTR
jgi:hypothetical protein